MSFLQLKLEELLENNNLDEEQKQAVHDIYSLKQEVFPKNEKGSHIDPEMQKLSEQFDIIVTVRLKEGKQPKEIVDELKTELSKAEQVSA